MIIVSCADRVPFTSKIDRLVRGGVDFVTQLLEQWTALALPTAGIDITHCEERLSYMNLRLKLVSPCDIVEFRWTQLTHQRPG